MRPVGFLDLCHAARVLLLVPVAVRAVVCDRLILEADAADRFRKRFGRVHVDWGNGALSGAAIKRPMAAEPAFCSPVYAGCLALVCERLVRWRHRS